MHRIRHKNSFELSTCAVIELERDGQTNRTKHRGQHLIIHGFKMMRVVFASLDERVFDLPKAA